jgi:TldD protein
MTVVLSNEAGGTMVHEAVGHGLEADLAEQGMSVFRDKIGEYVASPLVTVIDDATIPKKRGSYGFDDEGTPSQRTVLIENGVLKGFMFDKISAMKADKSSTGNGRRQSYQFHPITRMTNTIIGPGKSKPEDIIKSVDRGLFVRKMGGGQVNTVSGEFVFGVTEGHMIRGGELAEPVREATIAGNCIEIMKNIDMAGSDLEHFGVGTCGKDGQGVPVGDGQPTIRIASMTVGGLND